MSDLAKVRSSIIDILPADTSYSGSAPPVEYLYVPPTHIKALRLECQLVVGGRGVGKSVWTAALDDGDLRKLIGSAIPQLDQAHIHIGFAEKPSDCYPDSATFEHLRGTGAKPYMIWRAIVMRWLAEFVPDNTIPQGNWKDRVAWVESNPEDVAKIIAAANDRLKAESKFGVILFDALDRLSSDWNVMDEIVRELLRVALWLKSYSQISSKIFLREDQLERTVTDFPDASKLLATKAELSWGRHDLHGLLWQYFLNGAGPSGETFRDIYQKTFGSSSKKDGVRYVLSDELKRETAQQKQLFEALTGPWMGRDRRRGVPYIWTVGHLADGNGRTSPRSFLAAIRQAAEDTQEKYPSHEYVLHYESIKRGVQEASGIRVNELAEDYPWVKAVLEPLKGVTVPVVFDDIKEKWSEKFPNGPSDIDTSNRLPAQHTERGWDGIREDLLRIGVFDIRKDRRIDMPDLYRVGFGLGRKGGVKPKG